MLKESDIKRFWSFVSKSNKCWEWSGGICSTGRGIFWLNNSTPKAHRVSWVLHYGVIPGKLCVLHKCDNGKCVRPDHLFLGTLKDNTQDMIKKGRHVGNTKIDTSLANKIRKEYVFRKVTQRFLAKKYGVTQVTIHHIINFHRKVHV